MPGVGRQLWIAEKSSGVPAHAADPVGSIALAGVLALRVGLAPGDRNRTTAG